MIKKLNKMTNIRRSRSKMNKWCRVVAQTIMVSSKTLKTKTTTIMISKNRHKSRTKDFKHALKNKSTANWALSTTASHIWPACNDPHRVSIAYASWCIRSHGRNRDEQIMCDKAPVDCWSAIDHTRIANSLETSFCKMFQTP